jgi:hypothetical protein
MYAELVLKKVLQLAFILMKFWTATGVIPFVAVPFTKFQGPFDGQF